MIDEQDIKRVAVRMGAAVGAERLILFGSYARGDATEHSDVDLMIIVESELPRYKRSRGLYTLLRPHPFAMDLVVYTPQEVEKGKRSDVSFVSSVLREGKTFHDRGSRDRQAVAGKSQE